MRSSNSISLLESFSLGSCVDCLIPTMSFMMSPIIAGLIGLLPPSMCSILMANSAEVASFETYPFAPARNALTKDFLEICVVTTRIGVMGKCARIFSITTLPLVSGKPRSTSATSRSPRKVRDEMSRVIPAAKRLNSPEASYLIKRVLKTLLELIFVFDNQRAAWFWVFNSHQLVDPSRYSFVDTFQIACPHAGQQSRSIQLRRNFQRILDILQPLYCYARMSTAE